MFYFKLILYISLFEIILTNINACGCCRKSKSPTSVNKKDLITEDDNELNEHINPLNNFNNKDIKENIKEDEENIKEGVKMNYNNKNILYNNDIMSKNTKNLEPGLIGLNNIGATCYMNAVLQCFSNVKRFREYILKFYDQLNLEKDSNYRLSFAFAEVLKNLWQILTENSYSPEHFKKVIGDMNPLFAGIAAKDSKDLILFMLEKFHNEMNVNEKNTQNSEISEQDEKDLNAVYNNFTSNYEKKNLSIISQEFYGYNNTQTTCCYCNVTTHNVAIFNMLFFPLKKVLDFKKNFDNTVSILDCFDYSQEFDENYPFYCKYCRIENSKSYSQTVLIDAPQTLIINLNRGDGKQFNVNIVFDEYLNLQNYVKNQNSVKLYELIGVICLHGESGTAGHFIAFCKNSDNKKWYKFNDAFVDESNFDEVKSSGMPYVLFYTNAEV